jgi:signal peptidase I
MGIENSASDWFKMAGIVIIVVGIIISTSGTVTWASSFEWMKSLGIAIGLALVIRWGMFEPYRIPSESMDPTLYGNPGVLQGDRVFVNKWAYGLRVPFMNKRLWYGQEPQRWDIVVFKSVEENATHGTLVKRLVGMPGERIHIADGKVHVNGEALDLPPSMPDIYYTSPQNSSSMRYGILPQDEFSLVPEGHYLLLGDNSANSRDGRVFGWVPNEHFVGRVSCIAWPVSRWRDFTGFTGTWWWKTIVGLLGVSIIVRLFIGRSWAVRAAHGRGVDHLFIAFTPFGLRLPMTQAWITRWGAPKRGDVIFYAPAVKDAHAGVHLVGRIAGLPGEKISFEKGILTADNQPIDHAPLALAAAALQSEESASGKKKREAYKIPQGEYFVLAHDPADEGALDSRELGGVPEANIQGMVKAVWWPLWRIRKVH